VTQQVARQLFPGDSRRVLRSLEDGISQCIMPCAAGLAARPAWRLPGLGMPEPLPPQQQPQPRQQQEEEEGPLEKPHILVSVACGHLPPAMSQHRKREVVMCTAQAGVQVLPLRHMPLPHQRFVLAGFHDGSRVLQTLKGERRRCGVRGSQHGRRRAHTPEDGCTWQSAYGALLASTTMHRIVGSGGSY
jgi:hypothetical protein